QVFLFREPENEDLILVIVPYRKSIPLGFLARRIVEQRKKMIAEGKGVYLDSDVPNLSNALIKFATSEIYPDLGVQVEIIKTDYVGRYHWANVGFKFMGKDKIWYKFRGRGPACSALEVVQYNFRNFLKKHSLKAKDLRLPLGKSKISDLVEPKD